jgi:hypothetical protein
MTSNPVRIAIAKRVEVSAPALAPAMATPAA